MKSSIRYFLICLVGLPLLVFAAFKIYLLRPRFFPKFPVGSCVVDTRVHRIHKITGSDDWFKGSGAPTRIIISGVAAPGVYSAGSEDRVDVNDSAIQPIRCP